MGSIVTFYSYKGGVGRTMAVANIAVLLSRMGLRVLAVDWDLEAPGLDQFFKNYKSFSVIENLGLLDLLTAAEDCYGTNNLPDWQDYVLNIDFGGKQPLSLITSGKRDPGYTGRVLSFDWNFFFAERNGGNFIESLRNEWRTNFDVTLVDSRTGITDSGGICTIQLPDIIILVFSANYQSLNGVKQIAEKAQEARQKLAFDRTCTLVFPLPSRFDSRAQYEESQQWLEICAEELKLFYRDWLPKEFTPLELLKQTKLPYIAYYSFGEKLPVLTEGTSDPEGLGHAYLTAATLIANDFKDVNCIIFNTSISALEARRKAEAKAREEAEKARKFQEEARIRAEEKATLVANINKKLRQRAFLSFVAVVLGLTAWIFGISSLVNSQEAQLKERAADLKTKLFLSNEIGRLLESIQLVGDNQKFNQRWFKPENKLVPQVQSVLYQAVEESRERYVFDAHEMSVNSLAFSLDGQYIVSGSSDKTVKLWDVKNQVLLHTFDGHESGVNSVAFSPDAQYIVSGSSDNTVKLWDVENQVLLHSFNDHKFLVNSVAFSPDGQYIVSGSSDNTIKLWDVKNKVLLHTFNGHEFGVNSVDFSPDGQYIVSGSSDKTVKLWDVKEQVFLHTFDSHQGEVNFVVFSPDGQYIVSGSDDKTVKLWNVKDRVLLYTFTGRQQVVNSVGFSPDGQYIVSGSSDMTVKLWIGIGWQDWLAVGCKRIRLHPALVSGKTDSAQEAATTCLEYGRWSDIAKKDSEKSTLSSRRNLRQSSNNNRMDK